MSEPIKPLNPRVKITVLKTLTSKDIFGASPPMGVNREACDVFKVGQTFIAEKGGKMPEGFCPWAWDDFRRIVFMLGFGGNLPWAKEEGTNIACCTDGYRPVFFELRRME